MSKPREWYIPACVGGFYDNKQVNFAVGPIVDGPLPNPGGVRVIEYKAVETLRAQLEMAIDVIRIISKGCPSHSPTCTCLRDHAYIALFKLEELEK